MKRYTNLLILLAVAALAIAPLAMGAGDRNEGQEPFAGSDGRAERAINETEPGYEPWFSPLFEPPSAELESALFALQAAIGAGVLGYYLGVVRTRRKLAAERSAERAAEPGDG